MSPETPGYIAYIDYMPREVYRELPPAGPLGTWPSEESCTPAAEELETLGEDEAASRRQEMRSFLDDLLLVLKRSVLPECPEDHIYRTPTSGYELIGTKGNIKIRACP